MTELYGGFILFLIFLVVLHYFSFTKTFEPKFILYIIILFFGIKGGIATLNAVYEILPIQMDAIAYHNSGSYLADLFAKGRFTSSSLSLLAIEPGYIILLGVFYFIFGKSVFVGFILNIFIFSLTSYNVYRIGSMLFDRRAGIAAAIVMLILPYSALDSTYLHRDPIINYLISEFFVQMLFIMRGQKNALRYLWISCVIIYIGILRRENLVLFSFILSVLALKEIFKKKDLFMPMKLMLGLFLLSVIGLMVYGNLESWMLRSFQKLTSLQLLQARIEKLDPRSAYLAGQTYHSYFDLIKYAPIRAVYFMFSPFPWDIFKKSQLVPLAEAIMIGSIIIFLPNAFMAVKKRFKEFFYTALMYLIIGIAGSGLIQSNSAGAQRHRTQFTFLIVAIVIPYLYNLLFGKRRWNLDTSLNQK
jgi:4-amino-4-deoxy-L-arabinose transferase-like glycosyltransferase